MASDLIFYTIPGNDFFQLPDALTTGSSIMPQKKNPDVLELLRAKYHEITAAEWQITKNTSNRIAGYHRDMQLRKPALMKSLNTLKESLEISNYLFTKLQVNVGACKNAMTEELYAADRAYKLMNQGHTFRDAYRIISTQYANTGNKNND